MSHPNPLHPGRTSPPLFVFLAVLCACGSEAGPAGQSTLPAPTEGSEGSSGGSRPGFLHEIPDVNAWRALATRPEHRVVGRTEVVKFLIDLAQERQLWFTNTDRFPLHYEFARDHLSTEAHPVLGGYEGHTAFNEREYRTPGRRFVMGTLVHYLDADLWTFEMIAGDTLAGDRVLRAFEEVQEATFFGDSLRYRPLSPLHEERIASVQGKLPTISADDVFAGIRYQPLTEGTTIGTLRMIRGALDPATVSPQDILVLENLPDEIPIAAGVISQPLQAPLGHLAILCGTRGTPNMGLRGAMNHPELVALEGQLVELTVGRQEFSVTTSSRQAAERAWAERRPAYAHTPTLDTQQEDLRPICMLRYPDVAAFGAKASQLGELCQVRVGNSRLNTPGGFAVPVAHYQEHLAQHGLDRGIPQMLADPGFQQDRRIRERSLADLRQMITASAVDPVLLRRLRRRIRAFPGSPRVILRSSTNAEDLPGFTGAGLYASVVLDPGADRDELAQALREVWASVWLLRAQEERDWYRIDSRNVAMGVIVQPFVAGARANGVALTANPFFEGRPGYFVNAQHLGGSVTGAEGNEIPEQTVIYTYAGFEAAVLSRSSRNRGRPVLAEPTLQALSDALGAIDAHFLPLWQSHGHARERMTADGGLHRSAAEVEFLVAGDKIVFVQSRPYTVRYTASQR